MSRWLACLIGVLIGVGSCASDPSSEGDDEPSTPVLLPATFGDRVDLGAIEAAALDECSGLVASTKNPGIFWAHNDSGDGPYLYAFDGTGRHRARVTVVSARARDWEDIAIGDGYLFVADIGDNDYAYDEYPIVRVPEPVVPATPQNLQATADTITLRYPFANRNAEVLLYDPLTRDLFIITKWESEIYRAPDPSPGATITLEYVGDVDVSIPVGGDITTTGNEIIVKSYDQVFYWVRPTARSVAETLAQPSMVLPYVPEPQGEAVAWQSNRLGYLTASEEADGVAAHLYQYPRVVE